MKTRLPFFIFFSCLILCNLSFGSAVATAEELILKVKENPTIAGWIYQKGQLENSYCLYERNYMILANANISLKVSNPILHIFKEHESDILSSSFSISNRHFVSLDSSGMLIERMFADSSKVNVRKVHERLKPASVAISPDDSVELVGFKNGFIQAHSLLKKAKKNVDVYFKAHTGSVYSIKFNALGNYFVSSGGEGKIKIWQAKDLSLIREVDTVKLDDSLSAIPAIFSPLNDIFVYTSSEKMLAFSDIQGKNIDTVFVADGIKEVHFTEKKDVIAVLTLMGNLEFYSISKGKYLGTIPAINELSIFSFSINIINGNLLIATTEGEIYLCTSKEIKNVKVAKTKRKNKQDEKALQMAEVKKIKEDKEQELSDNVLEYWGLEDGVNVSRTTRKPFFPIKDETPLEPPLSVVPHKTKEVKKAQKNPDMQKTLNQTIFDEEIEFQPSVEEENETEESYDDIENEEGKEKTEDISSQDDKDTPTEDDNSETEEEIEDLDSHEVKDTD